jgi:renalase
MTAEVLIVGAGLAGLTAARTLTQQGRVVQVLDKGRSVGGRLATRRIQSGAADTGAQFFTTRSDTFKTEVDSWQAAGLVSVWGHGWSDGSVKRTPSDGHSRYIVNGGMNALAKYLTKDLTDVRVDVQVASVERINNSWQLTDTAGNIYTASVLLMTPPVPQSLALLTAGSVPLSDSDRAALERIEYGPCLCGIFAIEGTVTLPDPGAVQDFDKTVYWMADNRRKGLSSDVSIITAHVEARYSRQHYDAPDAETLAFIYDAMKPYLAPNARIIEQQLKKWRYSIPLTTHPKDTLAAENLPLFFAGDAFGGRGRVEGAYLSGLAAGIAIAQFAAL